MDNYQIETAQNIKIHQNIASLGSRIGAVLLDFAFMYIYMVVVMMLFGYGGGFSATDLDTFKIFMIIVFAPLAFYSLLFEYYMNGQTPGKKILKIQVVKTDGSSADFIAYLIRWVFKLFEIRLTMGIVAIIAYLVNEKGQRLGDIVAGTTVVKLASAYKSSNVFINIDEDYVPTFPHVTIFSDEDMSKIKEFYIRARRNNDRELLYRVKDKIKEKLDIDTEMDDIDFVKTIIKDYYYYYYNDSESSFPD